VRQPGESGQGIPTPKPGDLTRYSGDDGESAGWTADTGDDMTSVFPPSTIDEMLDSTDCSGIDGAVAMFNPETNEAYCGCVQGDVMDPQKGCVPDGGSFAQPGDVTGGQPWTQDDGQQGAGQVDTCILQSVARNDSSLRPFRRIEMRLSGRRRVGCESAHVC